jgi:hypothetical protein
MINHALHLSDYLSVDALQSKKKKLMRIILVLITVGFFVCACIMIFIRRGKFGIRYI